MTAFDSSGFTKSSLVRQAYDAHSFLRLTLAQKLRALPSFHFTAFDQAFMMWGALTAFVFSLGQFSTMSWTAQAILDAALTGIVIAVTSGLTWAIATQAKLRWVIFLWAVLMAAGVAVTAYGVFYNIPLILANLCLLWLGLCAVGYGAMAVGMRSRCFTAVCLVHVCAIGLLSYLPGWQFFDSGLVMASTLFFFSFVPWDMQAVDENTVA